MDPQTVKARNREAFKLSRTVEGDVEDVGFERYAPDAGRRGLPDDSSHTYNGRSADVNGKKTGPLRHPERGRPSGPCALRCASSRTYFWVTAPLATPPPADFTQTVVGPRLVVPRNFQVPSAGLTAVVPMRAPGQVPATAAPLWISLLAAKPPVVLRLLTPSTRSSPVPTTSWARLIVTLSAAAGAGAGAGAGAFTVCVTTAEVLVRKSRLPL